MRKFFFDMKDGVPFRDRVGVDFGTNAEAITHCKEMAQYFRDNSLRNDQDLEITVLNLARIRSFSPKATRQIRFFIFKKAGSRLLSYPSKARKPWSAFWGPASSLAKAA
jgi:hypothetical protein